MLSPLLKLLSAAVLLVLVALPATAQNESKSYAAKNGDFTFKAPSAFQDIAPPPSNAIVALEVPNFGVSFLSEKSESIDIEIGQFTDEMKKKLAGNGAKIVAAAKGTLCGKPAVSFLIGGVKAGKESLFVFNLRDQATYTFVMNYPEGQRKDAQDLWGMIAPSIKFKQ